MFCVLQVGKNGATASPHQWHLHMFLYRRGYIDCVPTERILKDGFPRLEINHKSSQILIKKGFFCQNSG